MKDAVANKLKSRPLDCFAPLAMTAAGLRSRNKKGGPVQKGPPLWTVRKNHGSGKDPRDREALHQFARLVQVVVNDRGRVDPDAVVNRREQFAGVNRVLQGS